MQRTHSPGRDRAREGAGYSGDDTIVIINKVDGARIRVSGMP
jgi:hypothetical protein